MCRGTTQDLCHCEVISTVSAGLFRLSGSVRQCQASRSNVRSSVFSRLIFPSTPLGATLLPWWNPVTCSLSGEPGPRPPGRQPLLVACSRPSPWECLGPLPRLVRSRWWSRLEVRTEQWPCPPLQGLYLQRQSLKAKHILCVHMGRADSGVTGTAEAPRRGPQPPVPARAASGARRTPPQLAGPRPDPQGPRREGRAVAQRPPPLHSSARRWRGASSQKHLLPSLWLVPRGGRSQTRGPLGLYFDSHVTAPHVK